MNEEETFQFRICIDIYVWKKKNYEKNFIPLKIPRDRIRQKPAWSGKFIQA